MKIYSNPFILFRKWFQQAIDSRVNEPTVMSLATSYPDGRVSVRMVLFKELDENGFVFYTNFESKKGKQIVSNPNAAIAFYWPEIQKQIRAEGEIKKVTSQISDIYFNSRPYRSKVAAWSSHQSLVIPDRKYLEKKYSENLNKYNNKPLTRPPYWGGYCLIPDLIEFWQARKNRLHDRIQYTRSDEKNWKIEQLAP